ncbi:hypothetical protein [Thalassoglobus polymorphus]|uniref:Uncharacterized protein n=1 Tax=Thalassoglobus polymorphus TaxID=2527994 RepID=A0A517QTN6_9PLAN|nr:hypothetical protein [Thalassoglobus polymorphus]QDT34962.1 hypothetical protein Mal48_42350 [Thalassoglobus polymorphus]
MDPSATNSLVNSLLIEIHRSLVQYGAEASPWSSDADSELLDRIQDFASKQDKSVSEMVDFLRSRKHLVDFGVYPPEYTSLHFVGLGYFLDRMKESQELLLNDLESAIGQLAGDSEAVKLVERAIEQNQIVLKSLGEVRLAVSTS